MLAAAARAIDIPYPIVLVIGGLVLGFMPGLPEVELDPELVLVIFLPPLLYSAAFFANLHDLRHDLRSISLLAVGLVLVTMCAVAVVAHALIDGHAVGGGVRARRDRRADRPAGGDGDRPPRSASRGASVTILEGESLINDGTALVAYRMAVAAVGGALLAARTPGWEFVLERGRRHRDRARRRLGDRGDPQAARRPAGRGHDLAAQRLRGLRAGRALGVSGVLAAVTIGIYIGWQAPEISTARCGSQGYAVWEILRSCSTRCCSC